MLSDEVLKSFAQMLDTENMTEQEIIYNYCDFTHKLFTHTSCISDYVLNAVLDDENMYIKSKLSGKENKLLDSMLSRELDIICELVAFDGEEIRKQVSSIDLPLWDTYEYDIKKLY